MVLALLTEVIALHMQITIVQIGISGLERPLGIVYGLGRWGCWGRWGRWGLVSDPFDTSLHELLEKVIWRGQKSGSRCRA